MILQPHEARAVASGRKTMLRVPVGEPRTVARKGPRGLQRTGLSAQRHQQPFTPRIGREYAIQPGVGRSTVARIRVTDTHEQWLGQITFTDARREGHRTTDDFRAAWTTTHDKAWMATILDEDDMARDAAIARFNRRHAATRVHVISFELVTDTHLLLADVRRGRGDYTPSPGQTIDRDAECIDTATQERYAKTARERGLETRRSFQRDLEAERARRKATRVPGLRAAAQQRRDAA